MSDEKKSLKKCIKSNFKPAYGSMPHFYYLADETETLEDMKSPSFWSIITNQSGVCAGAIFTIVWIESRKFAEMIAWAASREGVVLDVLREHQSEKIELALPDSRFYCEDRGPKARWSVIDRQTKRAVQGGFATEGEAMAAKEQHERAVSR